MQLFLVRHGQTDSNIRKIYAGNSSEPLTKTGIYQSKNAANILKTFNITSIYLSPIRWAVQTDEIIRNTLNTEVIIEESFCEMELGPGKGCQRKKYLPIILMNGESGSPNLLTENCPGGKHSKNCSKGFWPGWKRLENANIQITLL